MSADEKKVILASLEEKMEALKIKTKETHDNHAIAEELITIYDDLQENDVTLAEVVALNEDVQRALDAL